MRHNKALPLTTENMLKSRGGKERKNTALMHECAYSINKPLVIGFVLKETLKIKSLILKRKV